MFTQQGTFDAGSNWQQLMASSSPSSKGGDSQARRPPNAFILYSQAMRSEVRQQNPSLSNIEISRILGKMWKEVPNDTKLQYKQQAAKLQEEFKHDHPDYTYQKARRKRALNELLAKNSQAMPSYDQFALMQMNQMYPMQGMPQMYGVGQVPGMGQMTDMSQTNNMNQQMNGMGSIPGMGMPQMQGLTQNSGAYNSIMVPNYQQN
ncbi:HMG box family protein [Histomonas meleagridis]|uniref:HMG box family protein n=1 Tax=Histomonas meleagridis TaxID=135588 RepID=UPI00355AC03A|nr:HMG box family protein [Histomonas meleagridis]KAH0800835.1 HMG box family protein [Histomonas meleagridis]